MEEEREREKEGEGKGKIDNIREQGVYKSIGEAIRRSGSGLMIVEERCVCESGGK